MAGIITKLKKSIKNSHYYWRNVRNKRPSQLYQGDKVVQERGMMPVLQDLRRDGIAYTTAVDLLGRELYQELVDAVKKAEERYEREMKESKQDEKDFVHFILGLTPTYEEGSVFARVAQHPKVQALADAYFKMKGAEMRYYNVWHSYATDKEPSASQLWHRDREDLQIMKMFIYLSDVDETKGPFTYAPGTHLQGPIKGKPEHFLEKGVPRTSDDQMHRLVPKDKWRLATGNAGSVIFADTHGYHKGGYVRKDHRLLFTAMYVSPGCERYYFTNSGRAQA